MPVENSIKLQLPNDLYAYIVGAAQATGRTRQEVVRDLVRAAFKALKPDR